MAFARRKILEESSPQNYLHAHSQDSDHTEDEDSPEQHGINQGGGHHDVTPSAKIHRPLGRMEWLLSVAPGRCQVPSPATSCRRVLSVMTEHEPMMKPP
jgi:hypothetical protein